MATAFAIALIVGVVGLIVWIILRSLAVNAPQWERADPELVGRETERLARLAHRILWVNPRAGGRDFAPAAGGMAAALPHVDALLAGDSLDALGAVVEAIAAPGDRIA